MNDTTQTVDPLLGLTEDKLILLAMTAFLYKKREGTMTDEALLGQILFWFDVMTMDVPEISPETLVHDSSGRSH